MIGKIFADAFAEGIVKREELFYCLQSMERYAW